MDLNVYNYMLAGFEPKQVNKYGAHKNSELRSVLHDIAKKTKSSPVYLVKLSDDKQNYALNIKESSMSLSTAFMELTEQSESSIFTRKKAISSDVDQVDAEILGEDYEELPDPFTLRVRNLAKPQVNQTKDFFENAKGPAPGTYRFKINVSGNSYDFQYNIKKDATNGEVIGGLSDFITKARIGIYATPVSTDAGKLAMRLETTSSGTASGEATMGFEDIDTGNGDGVVSYLGMNRMEQAPENSDFLLNGIEKHSMTNSITIDDRLEVKLKRVGEGLANIGYMPDSDLILDRVRNMQDSYNQLVESSWKYAGTDGRMPKLVREMRNVFQPYVNDMESSGLTFNNQGYMEMDDSLAEQAALDGTMRDLFGGASPISLRMMAKTNSVKLDPMEYVDKTLVSYPNTSKPPVGSAYMTSLYSGMLFNYYC